MNKLLYVFILTLITLYNPKVWASNTEVNLAELYSFELTLEQIEIIRHDPYKNIDDNLTNFNALTNLFEQFREDNIKAAKHLLSKIENKKTFTGDELYLIKKRFDLLFKINSYLMEFGHMYEKKFINFSFNNQAKKDKNNIFKAQIIWLSSTVMALDHLQQIYEILFAADGSLRRIVKSSIADKTFDDDSSKRLKQFTDQIKKVIEIAETQRFQQSLISMRERFKEYDLINDPMNISTHYVEIIKNDTAIQIARGKTTFEMRDFGFVDTTIGFFNKITNAFSGFFGNIAGSIKWRTGHLKEDPRTKTFVKSKLQPMDIILDKSPFILTDKFIPGHFGHVAIYLGTKEELEAANLWTHPDIVTYQDEILKGKVVLEAVRPGVKLSTLEDFMNIDEFMIMRKKDNLSNTIDVIEQISRGIDQLGKPYDFNFDISTLDKIVCSELIYIMFGGVNWPTEYRLGRPTITPDDIAEILFYRGTEFDMQTHIVSTKRHQMELAPINYLAGELDYELRAYNGAPITDLKDPDNRFWKKDTKCYNVNANDPYSEYGFNSTSGKRKCRTVYKEYTYEENGK